MMTGGLSSKSPHASVLCHCLIPSLFFSSRASWPIPPSSSPEPKGKSMYRDLTAPKRVISSPLTSPTLGGITHRAASTAFNSTSPAPAVLSCAMAGSGISLRCAPQMSPTKRPGRVWPRPRRRTAAGGHRHQTRGADTWEAVPVPEPPSKLWGRPFQPPEGVRQPLPVSETAGRRLHQSSGE
ncbi:hypothetical protein GJAV_G00122460 [Gymnothorax javanicus]|nr:hypothetical protein GJAV_G00122460 [Gymnothorax javanicus]